MLKAVVNLNRKITRDYNSTGYGVSIEGEIAATPDDHEGVLVRVKELFALAEEALAVEIDRDQGEGAIARRDEEPKAPSPQTNGTGNNGRGHSSPPARNDNQSNGNGQSGPDKITEKQVKYVFTLAKRSRLSTNQLESEIEHVIGRRAQVYDLTKREAGQVIDAIRVYFNRYFEMSYQRRGLGKIFDMFTADRITQDEILDQPERYLMIFRTSMSDLDFDKKVPAGARCLYSYWDGYLKKPEWIEFISRVKAGGGEFHECHTSGHIFADDIVEFVRAVNPKAVVPIHTFAPEEFTNHFPRVLRLEDGRSVEISGDL